MKEEDVEELEEEAVQPLLSNPNPVGFTPTADTNHSRSRSFGQPNWIHVNRNVKIMSIKNRSNHSLLILLSININRNPLDTIDHHQSQRHDIAYQEPPQPQPLDTIHYHQSHQVQFWQATIGSHQMQLHDIAYHEPQPPDTVQDQLPQFWAAPLDSYPPRCHDIQYSQPRPLDAIEYQYLYQSGPLTTYENVIESCTQDKSNGDIKKVDHALKIHLTPRGIKREAEEEEDEKRRRKKKEGGVEASKEDLE
ncbi:unnamed protein product [Brassica napus]|uniref:(rape) hypothetical protein n=1 Tax=Brassica napus TaxID=3708 RepID=A0A816IS26_BRANA|nr:unnamed protein product [Brassica napus]